MATDREIAEQVKRMQASARDFGLVELPSYAAWAARKLEEGESPALIANLDARSMWLSAEDLTCVREEDFEELLMDLKASIEP